MKGNKKQLIICAICTIVAALLVCILVWAMGNRDSADNTVENGKGATSSEIVQGEEDADVGNVIEENNKTESNDDVEEEILTPTEEPKPTEAPEPTETPDEGGWELPILPVG